MKARRSLLTSLLGPASILLIVGLLGGVAAGAAPEMSPSDRPAIAFDTAEANLQQREPTSPTPAGQREPTPSAPEGHERPRPALVASIPHDLPITARPGKGEVIGTMPGGSRYYDEPLRAWILDKSSNGRFGKVTIPYSGSRTTGWIRIAGLELDGSAYSVRADLSSHVISVMRLDREIMRFPATTGAPNSPTPVGRYFVTDRVAIAPGNSFGSYAFGLSGIQPNLPAGWSGGDQLAIHGTDDPSSIGTSASAGCLRVSEHALDRLKPLLALGTPVVITP
ncbi:MAG: L,D-transpeptidase [Actinomycetota bacterium]|nr:L,D-transpeptidase [Actinomycetota bacterium]